MLLSSVFDLVLKCSILFDKPGYKNSIQHFLSRYANIFKKNIKSLVLFLKTQKLLIPWTILNIIYIFKMVYIGKWSMVYIF